MLAMRNGILGLIGAASLALASPAAAAVTVFTSQAAFEAAAGNLTTEDYSGYAAGTTIADGGTLGELTYDFSGAQANGVITDLYNSTSGRSLSRDQGPAGLDSGDFFYAQQGVTLTLPYAVRAFGVLVNTNLPQTNFLIIDGETTFNTAAAYDFHTFTFLGVISDTAFSQVGWFTSEVANVAEIQYARAGGGVVPEPGTWALMILGFGAAGAALRRRRFAFA